VDVQLVLRAEDVPKSRMRQPQRSGTRLGWDSWLTSRPMRRDSDDAVFAGVVVTKIQDNRA
jgi:predicted component of type VI protein secretion system